MAATALMEDSSRRIRTGFLTKRCRWSWRPRYVELVSSAQDLPGPVDYQLLIFDQSCRKVKNKLSVNDIVTIRSGKNYSFQIYLNTGMFLFFKAGSTENQAAWMADVKMALGKGTAQFHVRVTDHHYNNLSLTHALLYCVGVNLPSHPSNQLDRVLVIASPVSDINLHAWNLNRVKKFMVLEAGIQMELCSSCMGTHQKKLITFILRELFIPECIKYLLHEMQATGMQPSYNESGLSVYNVPHTCIRPNRVPDNNSTAGLPHSPPPYCSDAELAVLHFAEQQQHQQAPPISPVDRDSMRARTISTVSTQTHEFFQIPTTRLPPRNDLRPNYQQLSATAQAQPYMSFSTTVGRGPAVPPRPREDFETPYRISQRIYISDNGAIKQESQVLGSGSGEFRGSHSRVLTETSCNPVYISSDDVQPGPPNRSRTPVRPEFIGRRPPMLPPRGKEPVLSNEAPPCDLKSHGQSEDLSESHPPVAYSEDSGEPPTLPPRTYIEAPYANTDGRCDSSLSMTTDDITNADFALMTKVSFRNIRPCLPPRSSDPPRTSNDSNGRKPVPPLPRGRESPLSSSVSFTTPSNPALLPRRYPSPPDVFEFRTESVERDSLSGRARSSSSSSLNSYN